MKVLYHTQVKEIPEFKLVKDILSHLNIIQTTVIVLRNNEVVEPQDNVKPQDQIEIIKVVSGG